MSARHKVVPPVTPRIVQERPRQRLLRYALIICAVMFAAWLGYESGRDASPGGDNVFLVPSDAAQERVSELERERDTLQQQVAKLEKRVKELKALQDAAQARAATPQQPAPPARAQAEPEPELVVAAIPEKITAAAVDDSDQRLRLEDVSIAPTAENQVFTLRFSVVNTADTEARVTGTLWIAVNGFVGRKPTRLSLKALSPVDRSFVKMDFTGQQNISEAVRLPADFRPTNVLIEAKPYVDKFTGTSATFDWNL